MSRCLLWILAGATFFLTILFFFLVNFLLIFSPYNSTFSSQFFALFSLQRIEYLAQLLQQEMDGHIDYEEALSLKKLHKCLRVHGSPTLQASKPELSPTPPQDPKPSLPEEAPDLTVTVTSAPTSTYTTSSQLHVCPSPSLQEVSCPSSSATSTGEAGETA